jgi:DNA-binding CsgD family transcriptional regulator
MAAGGVTNRELAEALFVTEKTVETHLTSVYRKLNIGGRAQLEAALGSSQGVGPEKTGVPIGGGQT